MAFTKSPEYNTHSLKRVPISYDDRYDPQGNFVYPCFENCFPTKENSEVILTKRSPITILDAWIATEPRGMAFDPNTNYLYVIYDNDLKVYTNLYLPNLTAVDTPNVFTSTTGAISFTTYRVGTYVQLIAMEPLPAEAKIHYWDSSNAAGPSGTVTVTVPNMSRSIVSMDGYIFIAGGDGDSGQRIYNSTIGSPATWNTSTDFIDAEMDMDVIYSLAKHRNHIVAFGKDTIEFFYNAGNELGSPLSRQVAYSQKMGLVGYQGGRAPVQEIEDTLYFFGGTAGSYSGVYKMDNFKLEKISDLFIDSMLRANIGNQARVGVYEHFGVPCFAIYLSNVFGAFVYKPDTKSWTYINKPINFYNSVFGTYFNEGGVYILGKDGEGIAVYKSGNKKSASSANVDLENITASYRIDNVDFDSNNQKHIKWIDVVGWFGDNAVTLFYKSTIENISVNWTNCEAKYQNVIGTANPLRWRNLGRTRGQQYYLTFSGYSDIKYKGLEIAHNQGTY